jgi:hypothetical protein
MTHWRFYLIGGLLASMFAVAFYIVHLQTETAKAKKAAVDAEAQTTIAEGTAQAIDRVTIKERTITNEVHNVVREIDALPSGEALVPDDVVDAWAGGIDGLRHDTAPPAGDSARKSEGLPKD